MQGHYSKRLYILLVLLVLGHEFNHVILTNALREDHSKQILEYNDEEDGPRVSVITDQDNEQSDQLNSLQDQNVNKRGVLFAASVATSLLNLGLDVLLKVKGCCVFYRSLCRYVKEFDRRKKNVAKYIKANNKTWNEVDVLKEWIKASNLRNGQIWTELIRIRDIQNRIVEMLSPDIIKKFNIEEMKLKKALDANNRNTRLMTYQQLSDRFESPFDSAKGTAMQLAGITGLVGTKIASSAFKFYKIRKISKTLRASYGAKLVKAGPAGRKFFGLSGSSLNKHIRQTSKSIYKAKFSGAKYGKFMKAAGKLMSVASIAMDIYSIVQKIRNCKKLRDNAKRSVREIKKAENEAIKMNRDLNRYKKDLQVKGVRFIKEQLTSPDLHDILRSYLDLTKAAPKEARDLRSASPIIAQFLSQIKRANQKQITSLQKQLIRGLKEITVYYRCYLRKLQLIKYTTAQCKKGTTSMGDLYNSGVHSFNANSYYCIIKNGLQFTQFRDIKKLVHNQAKKQNFNTDCIMNNQGKKDQVCRYKNNGYTVQQTAAKVAGMNMGQVTIIYSACPEPELTPLQKIQICKLRKRKFTESLISKLLEISISRLKTVKC